MWWGGERKTNQCHKNVNSCGDGIDPILVLIMSHSHMLFCSSCPTASQRGKKIFTNGFEEGNGIGQGSCECQARCVSRNACSRSLEPLLYLMGGREWITVGGDVLVGNLFVIGIILVVTWRQRG